MKTVIALSDKNRVPKLMEGGVIDQTTFKLATDIVAVVAQDHHKVTSEIISQMFSNQTLEDDKYLVIAVEFDANRKMREGTELIQYDVIQCLPMSIACSIAEHDVEMMRMGKTPKPHHRPVPHR